MRGKDFSQTNLGSRQSKHLLVNYTYIHNRPLHLLSQDYGLAYHIIHVLCVYFVHVSWEIYITVDPERQIFQKFVMFSFKFDFDT